MRAMVEIVPADIGDKPTLLRLLQLYIYEFSGFTDQDIADDGSYAHRSFDNYWSDLNLHPYLVRNNGHVCGFVFVRTGDPHDMTEFFVMEKYRRCGLGTEIAHQIFELHPGEWQVREMAANTRAIDFWRGAIQVPYVESITDHGPIQRFTIPDRPT